MSKPPKVVDEKAVIRNLSIIGIGGNALLSAFKLAAGFVGNSSAMISDGVHSLSDVFATLIAYIGVRVSKKPADASHPYGHERFECLASLVLGCILVVTAIGIGWAGVDKVASGAYLSAPEPGMIAMVAAVISIVVKEAMFWYTRHWARVLKSGAFEADAWHHRSDALSSIGALIGIGLAMVGFPVADPIASILICIIILKAAYDIMKNAINQMIDTPCDDEFVDKVCKCLSDQHGVVHVDELKTRQFGNRAYVDAEISVDGDMPLRDAHAIAENAHACVERNFPEVKHIMIHVNPFNGNEGN